MARKPAPAPVSTGYWLMKSEPDVFSWEMCKARGDAGEPWTGVRNYLARNNMRAMRLGDLAFFYHSNEGLEIVGVMEVIRLAHPDPEDESGTWQCVDVAAVVDMPRPVTLAHVKDNPKLAGMSLVTSMRLSVQPVTAAEWTEVCRMGGLAPAAIEAGRRTHPAPAQDIAPAPAPAASRTAPRRSATAKGAKKAGKPAARRARRKT